MSEGLPSTRLEPLTGLKAFAAVPVHGLLHQSSDMSVKSDYKFNPEDFVDIKLGDDGPQDLPPLPPLVRTAIQQYELPLSSAAPWVLPVCLLTWPVHAAITASVHPYALPHACRMLASPCSTGTVILECPAGTVID